MNSNLLRGSPVLMLGTDRQTDRQTLNTRPWGHDCV